MSEGEQQPAQPTENKELLTASQQQYLALTLAILDSRDKLNLTPEQEYIVGALLLEPDQAARQAAEGAANLAEDALSWARGIVNDIFN